MKDRLRRRLALLLTLCMVLSMLPTTVWASDEEAVIVEDESANGDTLLSEVASGTCGDNMTWVLTDDGTLTISGTGAVPAYDYMTMPSPWMYYSSKISSIVLGEGIVGMYDGSLGFLNSIEKLCLPNSIAKVSYSAFESTQIQKIYYNGTKAEWSKVSFDWDELDPVTIQCNDGNIYFGWENPLDGSSHTHNYIYVDNGDGTHSYYCDHCADGEWNIAHKLENGKCPCGYDEKKEVVSDTCGDNLTYTMTDDGILTISGEGAMYYVDAGSSGLPWADYLDQITTVVVEEGVTEIGIAAFRNCTNLTSVSLPSTLTVIAAHAFLNCINLESVVLPEKLREIHIGAFNNTGLTEITIPASVKTLSEFAVGHDELDSGLVVPISDFTIIGYEGTVAESVAETVGFKFISLGRCTITGTCGDNATWALSSDDVLTISGTGEINVGTEMGTSIEMPWDEYADSILEVVVCEGITNSGSYKKCVNLEKVTLASTVTTINADAFLGCTSLKNVDIPAGVTYIDYNAFFCCTALKTITIPAGVTFIGQGAFAGCDQLESVVFEESNMNPHVMLMAFVSCGNLKTITLSSGITAFDYDNNVGLHPEALDDCASLETIYGYHCGTYAEAYAAEHGYEYVCLWSCETNCHRDNEGLVTDATGTTDGYITYTCLECGEVYNRASGETGHSYDDGKVTTEPTYTTTGVKNYTCSVCAGQKTEEIAKINLEKAPFTDVSLTGWYLNGVMWAVENKVTLGTGSGMFSPTMDCTRGQIITMLWRAAGQPKAAVTNPFTDVTGDAYYYDAVLWAYEQGVTIGTGSDTFSPDMICTRAQIVTLLWRMAGSKKPESTVRRFADVDRNAYYYEAVQWALEAGITTGVTSTGFAPDEVCTRAEAVTFLYREDAA